ncbi:UDP-N-acetylglucosamine enolpyruvyl transferase [Priestia megaterium]|nr:UDP-N-acetylglucosamine enolpyruvyl transferase [Priestia megaterium]
MPNREYPYYFVKLGKLYYVNESCRNVKRKEISSYEFTNDELVAFPFDTQSITKQTIDECNGYIIVINTIFDNYIN